MKTMRLVLKIVALALSISAMVCLTIAFWDKIMELGECAKGKLSRAACLSDDEDYADWED